MITPQTQYTFPPGKVAAKINLSQVALAHDHGILTANELSKFHEKEILLANAAHCARAPVNSQRAVPTVTTHHLSQRHCA